MPISALVLTAQKDAVDDLMVHLQEHSCVTLGEPKGVRIPLVLETETLEDSEHWVRKRLPAYPGVVFVDVVQIDFSDVDFVTEPPLVKLGRHRLERSS